MASKLHAEASLASEGDREQRWIEWESLVEKHQQQQEQRRGDLYEETARSDDADDDILSNLFSDPDPHDLFCLEFTTKQCPGETDNNHTSRTGARICIELEGYKAELGQTLHSTGLTLWRASHRLCDFLLLDDYAREYIHEKRVLEVCTHRQRTMDLSSLLALLKFASLFPNCLAYHSFLVGCWFGFMWYFSAFVTTEAIVVVFAYSHRW